MLSMNKLVLSPLVRVFLFAIATMFAATNFADDSKQPLQLAALSDGFDAEQTYMMSCFACHSTGAAGAPKVGAGNAADGDDGGAHSHTAIDDPEARNGFALVEDFDLPASLGS